jgi:hypothetical protein
MLDDTAARSGLAGGDPATPPRTEPELVTVPSSGGGCCG